MKHEYQVAPGYLESAEKAGLLEVLSGEHYSCGFYEEPVSGEPQVLVEYAAPTLIENASLLAELEQRIAGEHPEARRVLMRVPAGRVPALEEWSPYLTYLRFDGAQASGETGNVRPATPSDDPGIGEWLVRAMHAACEQQGTSARPGTAEAMAQQVLDAPGRESFVYTHEGRAVAHITVMLDAHDEVFGLDHVDMIDVFADDAPDPREAQRRLVAAAIARAREVGLPLVGNVVRVSPVNAERVRAERITGALISQGWRPSHEFWSRSLDGRERAR